MPRRPGLALISIIAAVLLFAVAGCAGSNVDLDPRDEEALAEYLKDGGGCDRRSHMVDLVIVNRSFAGVEVYIISRGGMDRRLGIFQNGTTVKQLSRMELDSGTSFRLRIAMGGMSSGPVYVSGGSVMCATGTLEISSHLDASFYAGADLYPNDE